MNWQETTKQPEPVREFKAQIGDVCFTAAHEPWGWSVTASLGSWKRMTTVSAVRDDREDATHEVVSNARKLGWIE